MGLFTRRVFTKEEIKELFAEANKAITETNKAIAETNKAIDRIAARQEKTDEQLANLGVKMDKMNERYGGLSNNVGRATEQLFFNILTDNPVLKETRFDPPERIWHNVVGNCEDEYDLVMKNDDLFSIFILEVKFKATEADVEKILTKQKKRFNEIFPEYKDYEQHWALATFSIDKSLRKKAVASGLTVLRRDGDLLEYNPPMPCGK